MNTIPKRPSDAPLYTLSKLSKLLLYVQSNLPEGSGLVTSIKQTLFLQIFDLAVFIKKMTMTIHYVTKMDDGRYIVNCHCHFLDKDREVENLEKKSLFY